jgi:very-short-patch-repair endonuclease
MNSIEFARRLRQSSPDAERRFWLHIRNRRLAGYKFCRQLPIGPYVVDFVCKSARLIVELDGGQHAEQRRYDDRRDRFLSKLGYRVVRVWNSDVFENLDGVLSAVLRELGGRSITPRPSPARDARPLPQAGEVRRPRHLN